VNIARARATTRNVFDPRRDNLSLCDTDTPARDAGVGHVAALGVHFDFRNARREKGDCEHVLHVTGGFLMHTVCVRRHQTSRLQRAACETPLQH